MQGILTQATVAVELMGFGYVAGSFLLYAHHRLNESIHHSMKKQTVIWTSNRVPSNPQSVSTVPKSPVMLDEPKEKQPRNPLTVEVLRQDCQKAGIKWRNAHGKNKHLKKAEMIEALQQLETLKRDQSPKSTSTSLKPAPSPSKRRHVA